MITALSFIIALLASAIGAVSGLGGGVIIKPVMDAVSGLTAQQVNLLSACTVLAMSTMTLVRRRGDLRGSVDSRLLALAVGSAAGGVIGKIFFERLVRAFHPSSVQAMQAGALGVLCVLTLVYMAFRGRIRTQDLRGVTTAPSIGLILGLLSSFLGIGGGPFNLIALSWCFSMTTRQAALGSIFVIFFSQATGLVYSLIRGLPQVGGLTLALMVLGGVLGGMVGSAVSRQLSEARTGRAFSGTVATVALISGYNVLEALL